MLWEPGTSRLRIINDLLAAINYYALRTNPWGAYIADPYTAPGDRSVTRDLTADAIVAAQWTRERDLTNVPNRVVLVGQSSGDTPPLIGVAENVGSDDPLSIVGRGRVIAHVEENVEATSQGVIDGLAARKLADLSSPSGARVLGHAPVPLVLHDVIRHEGVRGAIQSWSMRLGVGEQMRTTVREVQ